MFKSKIRVAVATAFALGALGAGESRACCFLHCFDCFKPKETTFAPAPACDVCPQQVSYVPQTSYRTEYSCVPCTSYRPVSTCDPCGGAQTVMQPVTTYVRKPVMVPYTSYRPVVTRVNYAAPACSTCSGAAYSSPYYTGYTAMAPAAVAAPMAAPCATCGAAAAGYAPAATQYGAVQAYSAAPNYGAVQTYGAAQGMSPPMMSGQPPFNPQPGMAQPGMNFNPPASGNPTQAPPADSNPANQTFDKTSPPPGNNSLMFPTQPIPDTSKGVPAPTNSANAPRLFDPQNRATPAGTLIGPAVVSQAIFNTADRPLVFHAATLQKAATPELKTPALTIPAASDNWSSAKPSDAPSDGWQSGPSR